MLFKWIKEKTDKIPLYTRTLLGYFAVLVLMLVIAFVIVQGIPNRNAPLQSAESYPENADNQIKSTEDILIERTEISGETVQPSTEKTLTKEEKGNLMLEDMLKDDKISRKAKIKVPEMIQYPELPTGCESVALTIAFNSFGQKLDKTDIAKKYLIYGDDVNVSFVGDPFSYGGAGIFPKGLTDTAWKYINDKKLNFAAQNLKGKAFKDIIKILSYGIPVVVWTTSYYSDVMGYEDDFYLNEHCVVAYGYDLDEDKVYLSDPETGYDSCGLERFEDIYKETGKMAMVVFPIE